MSYDYTVNIKGDSSDFDNKIKSVIKDIKTAQNEASHIDIKAEYDLNKKKLEQEKKKLADMELSIDPTNIVNEIQKVHKEYEKIFTSGSDEELDRLEKRMSQLYSTLGQMPNGLKALEKLPEYILDQLDDLEDVEPLKIFSEKDLKKQKTIVADLERSVENLFSKVNANGAGTELADGLSDIQNQAEKTADSFKKLLEKFSEYSKNKDYKQVSSFWDELKTDVESGNAEAIELLDTLKLINKETGSIDLVSEGMVKSGGIIGNNSVLLATKNRDTIDSSRLKETELLKEKLNEAAAAGVNVARILDIVADSEQKVFFELQEAASGKMIGNYENNFVNPEVFEATDSQIMKLIEDLITLNKLGIGVDVNPSNIFYDKTKGFSFIDLDLQPAEFKNQEELIEDALGGITGAFKMFYEDLGNVEGEQATEKLESRIRSLVDAMQNTATKSIRSEQQSNSPSKVTEELGKDFADGYAKGIEESIPEVVNAAEKLAKVAEESLNNDSSSQIMNEGKLDEIINKMRELVELIQKISENSNIGVKFDDDSLDRILAKLESVRDEVSRNGGNHYIDLNISDELYVNIEKITTSLQQTYELLEKLADAGKETEDALDKAFSGDVTQEIEKQQQAERELAETREKLADSANQDVSGNIKSEADALDPLKKSLLEVIELIDKKTEGFLDEETLVKSSVENEANTINSLMGQLELINDVLKDISELTKGQHNGLANGLDKLLQSVSRDDFGEIKDKLFKFKDGLKELRDNLADMTLPEDNFISKIEKLMADKEALQNMANIAKNAQKIENATKTSSTEKKSKEYTDEDVAKAKLKLEDKIRQYSSWRDVLEARGEGYDGTQNILNDLDKVIERLKEMSEIADKTNLDEVGKSIHEATQQQKELNNAFQTMISGDSPIGSEKISAEMNSLAQFMQKNSGASKEWKEKLEACYLELEKMANAGGAMASEFNPLKAQIKDIEAEMRRAGETGISMWDRMKRSLKAQIAQQAAMYLSLQDFIRYFRTAFNTIKELDYALIDLRKTTTMSANDLNQFYKDANESAKQYGVTTKEIIEQAAQWSRLNKIGPLYSNI